MNLELMNGDRYFCQTDSEPTAPVLTGHEVIDIHSHILPAIDDGPSTMETSLAMAEISVNDGIKMIIATPHTDGIRVNSGTVVKSVAKLNRELRIKQIPLKIFPGYEIPYHLASELADTHTLAGSNYILLELPHEYVPQGAASTLYNIIYSGLIPIIAHPERNMDILMRPALLSELTETGALVQLTASSITGEIGPDVQQCAHYLLKKGVCDFIATDSHSPSFRIPILTKAYSVARKLVGNKAADRLMHDNPAMIIQASI